ncbi:SAM-dependent methyltransferase [Planotetraspora sp. GP83]|uniref:SAM-dependent methyltransferase n=1 Tax=Planotetraspora sp. GP83 TaxID=3156264 RepID=UPI0035115AFC
MAAWDRDPIVIDPTIPSSARMYDYYLGGKDNFASDREAAEKVLANFPAMRTTARENRAFLGRVIRYLAAEAGIRQFIDIGTGIPTANNTHQVAQRIDPDVRVIYVDNDPIVLTHARALLTTADGVVDYIDADLRDPGEILSDKRMSALDFSQPIAVLLFAILHFIPDQDQPYAIVNQLIDAVPPGSYLALSHGTGDHLPPGQSETGSQIYTRAGIDLRIRGLGEVESFFDGLDLVDPGVVPVSAWRPDYPEIEPVPLAEASLYGAVARKS